jgi:hypothetical protein
MLTRLFAKLFGQQDASLSIAPPPAGPRPAPGKPGATFSVDAVEPAAKAIWTESLGRNLGRRLERRILALPRADQPVANALADARTEEQRARFGISGSKCHPLVDAIHIAFSQHRPLTLSPDDIWLVIAQGFSHQMTAECALASIFRVSLRDCPACRSRCGASDCRAAWWTWLRVSSRCVRVSRTWLSHR